MGKIGNLVGRTFGRWKVLYRRSHAAPDGRRKYVCKCACGTIKDVDGRRLSNGSSKSCGCRVGELTRERFTTHSLVGSPEYKTWASMKQRCTNPNTESYKDYGAMGISYDPKWEEFEGFYEDMGERPEGTTLDRIDPNGNYCKENCRWSKQGLQNYNSRLQRTNTSGKSGVSWNKRKNKWEAAIGFQNRRIFLGYFDKWEDAVKSRQVAELEYYGFNKE